MTEEKERVRDTHTARKTNTTEIHREGEKQRQTDRHTEKQTKEQPLKYVL